MLQALKNLVVNRWQLPAALLGLTLAVIAGIRVQPPPRTFSFPALEADILALRDAGAFIDASNMTANLLLLKPPLPKTQQARLHDLMADIAYRSESKRLRPLRENLRLLLDHQEEAAKLGLEMDAARQLRVAKAHEWLRHTESAIPAYRAVLARNPDAETARVARLALVRLLAGDSSAQGERQNYLDDLLSDQGMPAAYVWRALHSAVRHALRQDDADAAAALLERFGGQLKRADTRGYYEYLWASVLARKGDSEAAMPLIEWVDQWLREHMQADAEMDAAGFLPALNRLLRADLEQADDRPQAALAIYEDTLRLQLRGDEYVWANAGRIEALAALDRHDAAMRILVETRAKLMDYPDVADEARARLRQALQAIYARERDHDAHEYARRYLGYALELTAEAERTVRLDLLVRLGVEEEQASRASPEAAVFEEHQYDAAEAYEKAAGLSPPGQDNSADLLWKAAGCYEQAGRGTDAARVLIEFINARSLDSRLAQAMQRLAAIKLALGEHDEALQWYERVARDFPELGEAARARLMKALVLIDRGSNEDAEAQLDGLLNGAAVTPKADVYRDGLRALCELLYSDGRYADAIGKIEQLLALYPDDDEIQTAMRMTLGRAYQASAEQLSAQINQGDPAGRIAGESLTRYRAAAGAFAAYLNRLTQRRERTPEEAACERLAALAQGDCLAALGTPEDAEQALVLFRQIVVRYQNEPIALIAQVRGASVQLRQGHLAEAARAIERARWLLRAIAPQAFDELPFCASKDWWEQYLNQIASSEMFRNELAAAESKAK